MSREPHNSFGLEELEPRVLLSANLTTLATGATLFGSAQHDALTHEVVLEGGAGHVADSGFGLQSAAPSGDIFAGLQATHSPAPLAQVSAPEIAAAPAAATTPDAAANVSAHSVAAQVQQAAAMTEAGPATQPTQAAATTANSLSVTSVSTTGSKALELTSTLKGPNAPPAQRLTSQDLTGYISDLLASASGSFTETDQLGSASLGGMLQLDGVQLVVTATLTNGVWSGSVAISANSATLFPGKTFSAAITSTTTDPAITGTYTIGGGYNLSVPNSAAMVLKVGEALTVTASGISLSYDPNGAENQVLATVQTATVGSAQFAGLPTTTLNNFAIRADGFSFDAFTLASATNATPSLGNLITTTGATLTVSNFDATFGTSSTNAALTGTVGLTLSGVKLYPAAGLVQFQATSVGAAYNFGGFDGTSDTGRLTLTVNGLKLSFGEAVQMSADSSVIITPGQTTIATIASATLSSPQFSGLGTLALTNVTLSQTGFSLGSADWTSAGSVSIGDIITASSVTVSLSSVALQYGATPSISGSIAVSAAGVTLFPGIPLLNLSLGSLSGSYTFGDSLHPAAYLDLHIPAFDLPIGDALTIHLGAVDFTPGQSTMVHVTGATVTANLFAGLPTFNLGTFDLNQTGFSLGTFSLSLNTPVTIGSFLSISSLTIDVNGFTIDKTQSPVISGSITVTLGTLSLFPGSSLVTSSFTNVSGTYDFGSSSHPGRFSFSTGTFTLSVASQLSITASTVTFTPGLATLATIGSATLTFAPLNGLAMTLNGLQIQNTGFSIASATATFGTGLTLGSILTLAAPTVTLTNINYVFGGALSGSVGFDTASAQLHLGSALNTSASHLSGNYDFSTKLLTVSMDNFGLDLAGFATLTATGASITYAPATDGTAEVLVGVTGLEAFLGSGTGSSRVGVDLTNGTLGLAVLKATDGTITYALDVKGSVALLGLPANTLSASGTVEFRKNTAGTVSKVVSVGGTAVHLDFTGDETTAQGHGVSLAVGTFVSVTGDFGFSQFTSGGKSYVAVGATNVNATVAAGGVALTVTNANVGLVVQAGATSSATTYALVASGGAASLTGVPGLTLGASGLVIRVRHGLDATTISSLPGALATPGGSVSFDFSNLGSGTGDVTDVEGSLTLNIANFVSIAGNFGFQQFTDNSTTYLAVGATGLSIVLGNSTTNLTLANASLGLIIAPGSAGNPGTYALEARGSSNAADTSLNGVTGLTLNATNLLVRVRKGLDVSGDSSVPTSVSTSGGVVTLDFAGLGSGSSDVTDIEGHLTLAVTGFGSLEGDFGFQSFADTKAGTQDIAVGATNVTAILGTATTNLTVTGGSFGLIIRPGTSTTPAAYALQASATSAALNGTGDLSVTGSNLSVRIRSGLDLATASGIPTTVHTSGGDVTPDFSKLTPGSGNLADVEGTVTVTVGSFVTLSGSFGFQSYTVNTDHYLAFGATNVTATLSAGSVGLTIAHASLGVIVKQGSPSSYALQAKGSSDPADTALTGVTDLSLNASNLLVRARSGLDPAALPSGVSNSIHTAGGDVTLDFTGLGGGTSAVTDIEGHLALNIANFASLEGDFGFQKFTDGAGSDLAIGAANVNATLGTSALNVSVNGASLGLLIKPGVGYALLANGGTDVLNGVPDLSISSTGLSVKVRSGLDPASIATAPTSVHVAGGNTVSLNFTGLGSADVTQISGTVSLTVANFASLSGTFAFTKQTSGNVTTILVGATNVSAFVGAADQSLGVRIDNASFALAIYRNSTATASTYALQANAPSIQTVGLPGEVTLSGAAMIGVNTTGAAVNVTIPVVNTSIAFTDGSNGSRDQRNFRMFGGHLTLTIGSAFTLGGDFSVSQVVNGTSTKLMIGAANVGTAPNTTVAADGGSDTYNLSNGTLGLVFFNNNGTNSGYAMTASATATVAVGTALTGTATLTIRRNTTTSAQNESVLVGPKVVSVVFSGTEIEKGTPLAAFQAIVLSNASLSIDNSLIITAAQGQSTTPTTNASSIALTGVTLTLQNPSDSQVLFEISAGSATYTTFTNPGVTAAAATAAGLSARGDGNTWTSADKDLVLTNVTFTLGTFASFTATSIDLQHYTTSANAVVNSFAFNGATITILSNGQPMVSLTGSPHFHYSSVDGFKLDSFTNPGFSFLGQSVGAPASSPLRSTLHAMTDPGTTSTTYAATDTTHTLGPITLVDPGVSLDNFQFNFASSSPPGSVIVNLSAVVHLTAANASIGLSSSPTHASITNLDGSFTLTVGFDLLHLTAPPQFAANGFSVKADQFQIAIGSFLTITATGTTQTPLMINPTASATQDLISFGSLTATLNVGSVNISGSASNFAIEGNGTFLAKPNFAVSLSLGQDANGNADASGMSWPSWLPLKSASVTLVWTNFNANPTGFLIEISATIDISHFQGLELTFSGSVTDLVIDPNLVAQGQFPITSIGGFAVSVAGNLYGGTVQGALIGGIVRFDANGNTVDGLGNISGTTTPATGSLTSAFYAGIEAGFNMAGEGGFTIMVGLSDFGPLQVFVEADTPIPLGETGLFLSNFRGGITFGASFPTITLSDPLQASDALQLRKPGFSSPTSLTATQWEAQLRTQVAAQYHAGATPGSGWINLSNGPFIIQAGATLYAASADAFRVDGDIFFDTSGKFLVIGSATIGETLSVGVKFFADLSQPTVSLLFLMEVPSQSTPTPVSPPIYSLYGITTFNYTNNIFTITIAGGADFDLLGGLTAHAQATLTLSFSSTTFKMTLTNASFTIPTIQSDPLGTVSGAITVDMSNGVDIWGGLLLVPNLHGLEAAGIYAGGQVYIKLNTTNTVKQVTLDNGSLTLDPQSFSLFINGTADFKISNQQVFELSGTLTLQINPSSLTVFVQAQLLLGSNPSQPLLTFNANGLIYVQLQGTGSIPIGFAAKMTLTQGGSSPNGVSFSENWVLVVNTTGVDVTFTIPSPVQTSPPSPPIPTVVGPDFGSSNPLATTSYEVVTNGVRTLVIPNGPPAGGLSNYRTWTPALANTAYFIIVGRGSLTVASNFVLTGGINVLGAVGSSGFIFSLDVNASLALKANGNTVFNFQVTGGLRLSNAGVAAALNISLVGGVPSNFGFNLNNASFLLELNTTGSQITINNIVVPAGTGGLFARVHITGDLTFLGGIVDLNGSFDLTITGSSLTIAIDANITFFNATLHASGFAGIYYDSSPGLALRIQLSLPGGAEGLAPVAALGSQFVIKGTFTLEINTSAITRYDQNNVGIAPGLKISVTNLGVYLFGFNLTGSLSVTISSAGFGIDIQNLSLNLFGFATISLSGYYHPDGSFRFTGSAGFQFGDHTFGIGGSITVTISNNGFSASIDGWVAAFGVQINGGGSIDINTQTGEVTISVYIYVVLIPAIHIHTDAVKVWGVTIWPAIDIDTPAVVVSGTATFHLGSTAPAPSIAPAPTPPPPPPTPPALAGVSNGVLTLYLGSDVNKRVNSTNTLTPAQAAENYVLTRGSDGTTVIVSALGFTQTYTGVTSILVTNTLDGNDTIQVDSNITAPVTMTLGSGNNSISTGGGAATVSITGAGTNQVSTGNGATITISGGGANRLNTGSNSTVTVNGNGANRITTNGGSAPITINGTGANGVTINNGYTGTVTIAAAASGNNTVTIANGTPTINVNGSGNNTLTVTSSGARSIAINGNGRNTITSTGAGATTMTIAGNGANSVVIGGGTSMLTVTGNGANQLTTGGATATVILRGSGANQVNTGAGFATVYDQGIGANTIQGGTGGGLYIGGLDQNGAVFASKAPSGVSAGTGAFSIQLAGYANYVLTDHGVSFGAFSLSLNGVHAASLAAGTGAANGANDTFALLGWSGGATLTGNGANNSLLFVPAANTTGLNYTLTDASLGVTGGITQTITLAGIGKADLVGASTGSNTYNVSGWTGTGSLGGPQGTSNTLIATNDVATFTLTDTSFSRTGRGTLALTVIQAATLTGGASANTFNVSSWSGSATLDGIGAGDTYTLTLTGNGTGQFLVNDSGPSGTDTVTVNGAKNVFVTANQVRVGTQRVTYSAIEVLNTNGTANGLTYYVQATHVGTVTNLHTGGASSTVLVGSTAGVLPAAPGVLTTIQGALSVSGGGVMTIDDTGANTALTGTLTPTAFTGFGMVAAGIQYQDLSTLTIKLGSGGNTLAINDITPATHTIVDGGTSGSDTVNASFAADFNGTLDLTGFEHGTVAITGNLNGTLNDSAPGHLETVAIGANGSIASTGRLNVGSIDTLSVGQDIAGIVTITGTLANLSVGRDVSGTVTETGVISTLSIGRDLTAAGMITASNATAALAAIGTMSVGGNLAGQLSVSGGATKLTVGGNLSGHVAIGGTLGTLQVAGDVSGLVTETGTISSLTIGGSLTGTGAISAANAADPAEVPAAPQTTFGNIVTMAVGHNLAGSLFVSGTLTSLTIGTTGTGNVLSGLVTVHGALTHLSVTGDISGAVAASGTTASLDVTGSILPTGLIKIFNSADPTGLRGNLTAMTVGLDVAGTILVSGQLARLTVGRDVSGTVTEAGTITQLTIGRDLLGTVTASNPTPTLGNIVTFAIGHNLAGTVLVSGALTTLTVGNDVSGNVAESGTIHLLTIGGSLTSSGLIAAHHSADPLQVPAVAQPTLGNIDTMTVGLNLAGTVNVTGSFGSLTVGTPTVAGNLSGVVAVQGALTSATVTGDVSGHVVESGTVATLAIGGSLTSSGTVLATNSADPAAGLANIGQFTIGADLAGVVLVTGTLSNLSVGHDVSGAVTEAGTVTQLTIGHDLTGTGTITAVNPVPTAGNIVTFAIGHDLAGTVLVSGALTTLTVGNNVSGTVTESGTIHLLTIGGSLTSSGRITAFNAADPSEVPATAVVTLGNLDTMTVGGDLAGKVNVSGTFDHLAVSGNVSGVIKVQGALHQAEIVGDVSGSITESGTTNLLMIGGSLTSAGVITATNSADPAASRANIVTMNVGANLAGTVLVSGTLTTLTVGGDISGTFTESGTVNLLTIGGSLTSSGVITAFNPVDPLQVPATATPTLGNIVTMTIGQNLAGHVTVSGTFSTLTVGGNLSGVVAVQGALDTAKVTGDVSGSVTETGTANLLQIGGSITATGLITATNSADPAASRANIVTMNVGVNIAGTVLVTGTLTTLTVGNDVSGTVTESGTVNLLTIGGSLTSSGVITAFNPVDPLQVPATSVPTLGNIVTMTISHDLAGHVAVSGTFSTLTVGGNLSGVVVVQGALDTAKVAGDVSGRVVESGTITLFTIGGSLTATGTITAYNSTDPLEDPPVPTVGNIVTMAIGQDLAGHVTVSGTFTLLTVGGNVSGVVAVQGQLTTAKIGGDVSGSITETGTTNLLQIGGSITSTGVITATNSADPAASRANIVTMNVGVNIAGTVLVTGTLTTLTVGNDVSGTVTESGTINLLTIGGSLTGSGVITAFNPADPLQVPTTAATTFGNIVTMSIGRDLAGKVRVSGTFTTLTVGGNLSGLVAVQGALTTATIGGDISGTVTESGTINLLTIGGSLTQTGLIKAVNNVATLGNIVTFTIGQDFAGTVIVSGNLHLLTIVNGSMTPTGRLTVGSLDSMIVGPDRLSLGQNMAGVITVLGTLGSLRVAGGTPGTVIAGHIGTIAVYGGFGPVVLQVIENGIERHIELASPSAPYPHPNPYSTASASGYVNVQFFYESGSLANPQLTARITNGVGAARDQYDFSLVTYSDTAKFNLARLDAAGIAGVRNTVVEGDLLTAVSTQAAAFFKLVWPSSNPTIDPTPAGIRLPGDDIAGVSIRDYAPNGYIQLHSIQAIAFGSHTDSNGRVETGAAAEAHDAQLLLTSGTLLATAADTFRVSFADLPTQQVGFFLVTDPHGGHFDEDNVVLTVQSVVTANATATGNIVTQSNVARGADSALITAMPTYDKNGHQQASVIQTIAIRGDGASIDTEQWISQSIVSGGSLGDLTLTNSAGITNVTASGIFGSIVGAPIVGTIQTTGLRTDPISDVVTSVSADIGTVYVAWTNKGVPYLTTTVIRAKGDGIDGRVISRGDLISAITADGGIDGTIAAQGNLGALQNGVRVGGLLSNGPLNGDVMILGQQLGDVTLHGGLKGGTYTVKGDIIGNLVVDGGLDATSRLVSGGKIGSAAQATTLTFNGDNKGIVAATGAIAFAKGTPRGYVFSNTNATNTAAINAIFTNGGTALSFDLSGLDLQGLTLLLTDVARLAATSGGLTGPTP